MADREIDDYEDYILSFGIFEDPAECHEYIRCHYDRISKTIAMIPVEAGKVLDVGGSPYCMTLMMREKLGCQIDVINYGSEGDVRLVSRKYGKDFLFPCSGINVETDDFPYGDGSFDLVVCAELIEHLTFCPTWMLGEIHRVLRPGAFLLLTTQNVLRYIYSYEAARAVFRGRNFYDPYSGYGPYGRHNREYTPEELLDLVEGCGFRVLQLRVCDSAQKGPTTADLLYRLGLSVFFGVPKSTLKFSGSQIFMVARRDKQRTEYLPETLYKSIHALSRSRKIFPKIP